jgi:hypothetical protein
MALIFEDIGPVGVFVESVPQQINFEPLLGQSYAFGDFSDDGLLISVTYKRGFPKFRFLLPYPRN